MRNLIIAAVLVERTLVPLADAATPGAPTLGEATVAASRNASVQPQFERAVAWLHSIAGAVRRGSSTWSAAGTTM